MNFNMTSRVIVVTFPVRGRPLFGYYLINSSDRAESDLEMKCEVVKHLVTVHLTN